VDGYYIANASLRSLSDTVVDVGVDDRSTNDLLAFGQPEQFIL